MSGMDGDCCSETRQCVGSDRYDALAQSVLDQVNPIVYVKLVHEVCFVALDGLGTDHQDICDLLSSVALCQKFEDVPFTARQLIIGVTSFLQVSAGLDVFNHQLGYG